MFDIAGIYRAASLDDALRAYAADPQAVVIAGGTDVLIKIREGKLAGCRLLSINGLAELRGIRLADNGDILIGPLTTFAEAEHSELLLKRLPMLAAAAGSAGGPQLREAGTLGGNICNGVTSADTAAVQLALEAGLTLRSADKQRRLAIAEWYKGPGQVDLRAGELLTEIRIKKDAYVGWGGEYIKYAMRNAMDIATLGCAVAVRLSEDKKRIAEARLAFGVAAPTPMRALQAETALAGMTIAEARERIAALVRAEINPRTSWRASREFRMQIAGESAARALAAAVKRAGGEC
ncbi:MAG: xanthine dehydrogenase FAD-binding subunit XdhB [Bacillota bacterium]|nr:xanthine dehydrogenase FAD-binding subunit XdhB [Bacillota bacterium]